MGDLLVKMLNFEEKIQMLPLQKTPPKQQTNKKRSQSDQPLKRKPHNYVFWNIFPDSHKSQGSLVESKKPKACFWENSYFSSDASRLKTWLI